MDASLSLAGVLRQPAPVLALAPMQEVTDLPFWRLMTQYGGADLYYTEYFRVTPTSRLDRTILASITENPTGKPAIAQMIGNDVPALVRTARELQQYPVAAVDLNLGCPAPVVYRKCAGGGLLRDPARVDGILGALRDALEVPFTVKTRLGFDDPTAFDTLLPIFARHGLDLLTIHGRTVAGGYRSEVDYEPIARAATLLPCPVLANGNIYSPRKAAEVLDQTGACGLMIGRAAIRNPWLFGQIRRHLGGEPALPLPTGREVLAYVHALYDAASTPGMEGPAPVQKMKRYMNFLGLAVEPEGRFLHDIRRVSTAEAFFQVCRDFLDHSDPMSLEPFVLDLKPHDVLAGTHV